MTTMAMCAPQCAGLLLPVGPGGSMVDLQPGIPTTVDASAWTTFVATVAGKALTSSTSSAYVNGVSNPTPPLQAMN
jgi:hypothetical protein